MSGAAALAARVRAARLGAGFSQRQLAQAAGLGHDTVSRLERGLRTHGSYATLAAIARATGVPITTLDPGRRALGYVPAILARRLDAAGPEGLDRRGLYRSAGRQLGSAAALDAALAPLLASGVYEQLLVPRLTRAGIPLTVRVVRRVQPASPTPTAPTSPPGAAPPA